LKTENSRAEISEVFASIQGEGLSLGTMQLFIRFGPANRECRERAAPVEDNNDQFWYRTLPGTRNLKAKNPITAGKLFNDIARYFPLQQFYCISMIGEEPLRQASFLSAFLPLLKRAGLKTFAQTTAPTTRDFAGLISMFDMICLDLDLSRRERHCEKELNRLATIIEMTDPATAYLRLTVDAHENPHILLAQLEKLPIHRHTLVLQPKMTGLSHISDWDTGTILAWINLFAPLFAHIRWIPQVHKLLRIP